MSKKTRAIGQIALSTGLAVGLLGHPAQAFSINDDPLHLFASCAGRMEAEVNFANAWHLDAPQRVGADLQQFRALVEAISAPDTTQSAKRSRAHAWTNQIELLWTANFSTVQEASHRAARIAAREVANCARLLLS